MFLVLLFSIIFCQIFIKPVNSISEFSLKKQITYQINKNGDALVNQQINLINNFSTIYAKQYSLNIENQQIEDVTATDSFGNIIDSIEKNNNQTSLHLVFNQPSATQNKTTDFTISYKTKNFVSRQGSIWKMDLPQHKANPDDQINITIILPTSMGEIAYSSIPVNPKTENDFQIIEISNNASQKNISMAFGQMQLFNLNISYYIKNDQDNPQLFSIPIPIDTPSQTIILKDIQPPPENITIDPDGNFLAQYNLSSKQDINILLDAQVQIHPINPNFPQSKPLPHDTSETQFWPATNPTIRSISANLNTPKQIYDYVVDKLDYNLDLINNAQRKNPLDSLLQPQNSLCTDFTDLFISLARSKSIPSREIQGIVFTTNPKLQPQNIEGDLLHAWPQFWNQTSASWQSIDPTWQKTTDGTNYFNSIDLNHISFVIHSQDDQKPLAPGFYKQNPAEKSIILNSTNTPLQIQNNPPIINLDKKLLTIYNPNPNSLTNLIISSPAINFSKEIPILPPYSIVKQDITQIDNFFSALPKNKIITFDSLSDQSNGNSFQTKNPYYQKYFILSLSGLILILSLGGIIILRFL